MNQKDKVHERRIGIILLVFNIFLFMKGISATYTASYLSIYNPTLVEDYMNLFQILPFLYLIPMSLFSVSFITNNNKMILITDRLGLFSLGLITVFLLFYQ